MSVLGALAAALALFATEIDRAEPGVPRTEPSRRLALRLAARPLPGGAYVANLVEAISPSGRAPDHHHDGMSLRELRTADVSGQTVVPLLVGKF